MRRAVAFTLLLAAAGCAMVGPDYQRPASPLPSAYGETAPTSGSPVVPQDWWKLYKDPVLDELVASGLQNNVEIGIATARVEEAEAALREAHAVLFFPQVDLNASAARGRTSATNFVTANGFGVGLSTSFEVDVWGRLRRGERSVRDQLLASQYGRDTVAVTLAATIARTYFALRASDAALIASRQTLSAANESLALAKKRADAGVAPELDVYQAGGLATAASAQTTELERLRSLTLHELAVLTGKLDLTLAPGTIDTLPIPPLTPPGLPSELLERRPDVRQAEADLAAATERIGVAKGAQFPALVLTGTYGSASGDLDKLFTTPARTWSIGAGLVGPILDGGRYKARTEQAEAQAKQVEGAYIRTVQNAFRDVSDALSNVTRSQQAEVDLKVHVEQAAKAFHLASLRYETGYSAYLEVLDAQRTLNDAQLLLIRNRQNYLSFTVDLMNSLGGGWGPPEARSASN
ncbi:MAG TPA: efflux transporter outer membrane subunit [Usitatibacter sp.]|nr:efflux transporter outer membrane subunit [Usitatibacter sp.]